MKKILAVLLTLMLLATPFASLAEETTEEMDLTDWLAAFEAEAETELEADAYTKALEAGRRVTTTITVSDVTDSFVGDATVDQIISDLFGALSITAYSQNGEDYLSIGMKQAATGEIADLLSFGFASADGVGYLSSNLLGGTIALSLDEVQPLMERLIDMLALTGMFTEEEAAELKAQLPEIIDMAMAEVEAATASVALEAEQLDITELDYSAVMDVLTPILERVETSEVTMQPKNCDPAATVLTASITGEEMEALLVSLFRFVQANPELMEIAQSSYDATLEDYVVEYGDEEIPTFEEALEQLIAEMSEEINLNGDTTLAVYLNEADELVYAQLLWPEQSAYDEEAVAETVTHTYVPTLTYTRLTMNDGVAHSVVMIADNTDLTVNFVDKGESASMNIAIAEEGSAMFGVSIDVTDRSAENLTAFDMMIGLTIVDEDVTDYEYTAETGSYEVVELDPVTTEITLKITSDTVTSGVDFTGKVACTIGVNGKDYCTIVADSVSSEPGASIMDGEVVRPAALSDADFANWFVGVYNGLQTWVYEAIMALPQSVLNLMMQ